ncbi:SGNH/GDSL hydrolase family protein [Nocardiopsis sp. HNM0947]|uniref:SGNH/GDSL hydrolase family protein n=1 Tax=Nocardiopsis coralli TaxID=2772213 RepID=A0ABR9P785_9ACTN|nr:SGNH/GDSL hydrolase family protein [Nocardiopsis coralli]MBE2999674.1 SGNH/GDSL hydrolase family protein [Nocardiopsis coralli]
MNPPASARVGRPEPIRTYVALGDSITEGMEDNSGPGGEYRGFADRLAEHLGTLTPDFRYANLGVRGRRMHHIFGEQLEKALEWKPDLVTVLAGGNDVLRPGSNLDALAEHFEWGVRQLLDAGLRVVIISGHDTGWIPVLRYYRGRIAIYSMHMRSVAERTGTEIVDLWALNALNDPRAWSEDRLHLNGTGHQVVAARIADLIGFPMGPREAWTDPWSTPPQQLPRILRRRENRRWARQHLVPWLRRRAMGRSSGDGRMARRPQLDHLYDEATRERLARDLAAQNGEDAQGSASAQAEEAPTISPSGTKGPEPRD